METQEDLLDEATLEIHPKIYSKVAIRGFAIFFTTIFGGVLLMQNLRDVGKKKEANIILLASVLFTAVTIFIVSIQTKPNNFITFLCNMIGAYILSEIFYRKYFPIDSLYEKKKIWKPLIISILIIIPFVIAAIYGPEN